MNLSTRAVLAVLCLAQLTPLESARAQPGRLSIVVIEGEDAVNVIQQRTAVAAVVEVRDSNGQPVAGATVTFTIRSGSATLNGARTLTVTTNAAGRAAASGLMPTSPGTVQMSASASFQGQTAATVTISQTNAMAAGAGVGAAVAGTAAGSAAAGGGLSALAIGAIAGGVGGGLYAAKAARASGTSGTSGTTGGRPSCVFRVSPTTLDVASVGAGVGGQSLGGPMVISVGLESDDCGPKDWTATTDAPFLTLFVDTSSQAQQGAARVMVNVVANPPGSAARMGTVTIAGQTVTVNQAGRCAFSVTPASATFPRAGGSVVFTVTVSPAICDAPAWIASTISNFISLSPPGGSGSGVVTATAAPYPFQPGGPPLTGIIDIARQLVQFVQ